MLPHDDADQALSFRGVAAANLPSAVLVDEIRSLDWLGRKASRKGRVPAEIVAEVRLKLKALRQI